LQKRFQSSETNQGQLPANVPVEGASGKKEKTEDNPPLFMRLWKTLGLVGCAASVIYYLNGNCIALIILLGILNLFLKTEADHYERKVNRVVKMIMRPEVETRNQGLDMLKDCFSYQTKLFTGIAGEKKYILN
jgi:hypothetical protein